MKHILLITGLVIWFLCFLFRIVAEIEGKSHDPRTLHTIHEMAIFGAFTLLTSIACAVNEFVDLKKAETKPKAKAYQEGKELTETP